MLAVILLLFFFLCSAEKQCYVFNVPSSLLVSSPSFPSPRLMMKFGRKHKLRWKEITQEQHAHFKKLQKEENNSRRKKTWWAYKLWYTCWWDLWCRGKAGCYICHFLSCEGSLLQNWTCSWQLAHKKIHPQNMRAKRLTGAVNTVCIVWVGTDGDLLDLSSKVL